VGTGRRQEKISQLAADNGAMFRSITHDYSSINWVFSGSDVVVADGTSWGEHRDGP
jgi:hypothetical protein